MTQGNGSGAGNVGSKSQLKPGKVIDFKEVRDQRLEEKRRKTERIFFKNLISVYSLISDEKMHPIDMIDVSEEGCSFQVPFDVTNPSPWPDKSTDVPIRLYFSRDTYLEIIVRVQNTRPIFENKTRYVRYGCKVEKDLKSYPAYKQFVQFLGLYAEYAHQDKGNIPVFYL